jgi:hypothetical protein
MEGRLLQAEALTALNVAYHYPSSTPPPPTTEALVAAVGAGQGSIVGDVGVSGTHGAAIEPATPPLLARHRGR